MDPKPLYTYREGPEGRAGQALAWVRRRLRWTREARAAAYWAILSRARAPDAPQSAKTRIGSLARAVATKTKMMRRRRRSEEQQRSPHGRGLRSL